MPLATAAKVEARLGLVPFLFNLNSTDQAGLDAIVNDAIEDADAEMAYRLGSNYDPGDPNAARMQAVAQAYLAADYVLLILRSMKVLGIHAPLLSEESDAFERLESAGFREIAEGMLSPWITISEEPQGKGFAAPVLLTGQGILTSQDSPQVPTEEQDVRDLLDETDSFSPPVFSVVRT